MPELAASGPALVGTLRFDGESVPLFEAAETKGSGIPLVKCGGPSPHWSPGYCGREVTRHHNEEGNHTGNDNNRVKRMAGRRLACIGEVANQ